MTTVKSTLVVLSFALLSGVPAAAQSHEPFEVFAGWAPVFLDDPAYHILPAWAVSISGAGSGRLSLVADVSGWYFTPGVGSIHNVLGGVKFSRSTADGVRPFAQALAGMSMFHAYGTGFGVAFVPGGGVDFPVPNGSFAVRIQGDYFGIYAPGDYGHYWGHLWRISTGVVFRPGG